MNKHSIVEVKEYAPRDRGIVHAVLWNGKAECLVGMPDFNLIVQAIQGININGYLDIRAKGIANVDTEEVAPFRFYIVYNTLKQIEVWPKSQFEQHYLLAPTQAAPTGPTYRGDRDPIEIVAADRPDGT